MTQMITYQTNTVNLPRNLSNIDLNSPTEYQPLYDYSSLRQPAIICITKEFNEGIRYNAIRKELTNLTLRNVHELTLAGNRLMNMGVIHEYAKHTQSQQRGI